MPVQLLLFSIPGNDLMWSEKFRSLLIIHWAAAAAMDFAIWAVLIKALW